MISRSRRKPPTTAQNTWTTTSEHGSSWCLRAALAAMALFGTLGGIARADDGAVQAADFVADTADSGVEQVSYTVSESGHAYKWMSYAPKQARRKAEPQRAEAAQFTTPAGPAGESTGTVHPENDPFGDRQQPKAAPALPSVEQLLVDDTNKKVPLESLITPPGEGGDTAKKPLTELPQLGEGKKLPSTEDYLAADRPQRGSTCQDPDEILHRISELDHLTEIRDASINPDNRPTSCALGGGDFVPRQWAPTTFMWQASGLCHKPAYFEDVHLERYGHSWGPYVQPLMSGAHFFLNVPILPYKMGLYPPNECIYTLGYYRPGSCAPYMLDPLPLSVRAALAQGGAAVGMAYLIP